MLDPGLPKPKCFSISFTRPVPVQFLNLEFETNLELY